jgi:lipopolysaccharide export system protein LptA
MGRALCLLMCVLALASCSKRERSDPDADEWKDIQALADDASVELSSEADRSDADSSIRDFQNLKTKLAMMKTIRRQPGETLLTGKQLVFDYDRRRVEMEQDVHVVDDQGELDAARLIGRFTPSNTVETIEASGGVAIRSDGRTARSGRAVYEYARGLVRLQDQAVVELAGNELSAEQIKLWMQGSCELICEPNARIKITNTSGLNIKGVSNGSDGFEMLIRSDRMVYDEEQGRVELVGNVRMRDPRAAMNCGRINLYLKDGEELDWLEALTGVIIQTQDRKALAERATYHASDGRFTLDGDPKVKLGLNVMTGDRITFWHETQRMVCEPNARVLLYLDEETKEKFLKDLTE